MHAPPFSHLEAAREDRTGVWSGRSCILGTYLLGIGSGKTGSENRLHALRTCKRLHLLLLRVIRLLLELLRVALLLRSRGVSGLVLLTNLLAVGSGKLRREDAVDRLVLLRVAGRAGEAAQADQAVVPAVVARLHFLHVGPGKSGRVDRASLSGKSGLVRRLVKGTEPAGLRLLR